MGILNILQSGRSGMTTSKAGIATSGHNISNAGTDGYSRQRVHSEAQQAQQIKGDGGPYVGQGSKLARIERVNDEYLEKQLRDGSRDMSHFEEKQVFLGQVEDVFNEMNGDGLNRIIARYFNDFRKLSNDPSSEAIRQSVRESSQAMINDFKRIRTGLDTIRSHIDTRIEGNMKELNALAKDLAELNIRIKNAEVQGHTANDLQDSRDTVLKKMAAYADLSIHKDNDGSMIAVDVKGIGPLVTGPNAETYYVTKTENGVQIARSQFSEQYVTEKFQSGKIGALVEMRDKAITTATKKLDELAHAISTSVNEIHSKGVTLDGATGIHYFKQLSSVENASKELALSDAIKGDVTNIAAGITPGAPSDNRLALALSNLQHARFMNGGQASADDYYNSIVSDIGVASARNNEAMGQQKGILTNMQKMRDQISGVSIDEEVTNLMQYQHAFDASARVIKVADEMLDTILRLRG